ncbi:MAG: tyrosine--tRNA ligase [Chloroflexi bacterium]|nr:tyrosine--tRNA ligase [Chloroflexota bacterium]MCI0580036.1 tyrosine--tRNA ligase [Chloroflexota bacterium]MCI0646769.1 tyrosine--tRNA ligase [Chloroflexota bacterium]MCI0730203.1 tyrosine--tRNA ligase [Chloroflexota bacterium]
MLRPIDEQVAILMQGTEYGDETLRQNMEEALRQRLAEGRPLRVYCGFDPRTSDLHLGHTVPLYKLRQFQELGHQVVFLVGTFTSLIGDPSDQDQLRPQLTLEQTLANAATYAEQAFAVLDRKKTTIRFNHAWLQELTLEEFIHVASHFTVQQFLTRENFRDRFAAGDAIYLHEFFYALLQGYDAVALETDVQVGGTDQLFNIVTAGRKLQSAQGQKPQIAIIHGILPGTDGVIRMSKSRGNHIPIRATPEDMYGKVMSLPDQVMPQFFRLVTRYEPAAIAAIVQDLESGRRHPRDVKMELAREIVSMFHGLDGAAAGEAHFRQVFQQKEAPDEMVERTLVEPAGLVDLIYEAGLASSKSQVRRLIQQGGVRLNGHKVEDVHLVLEPNHEQIIQVGKRHFLRIKGK